MAQTECTPTAADYWTYVGRITAFLARIQRTETCWLWTGKLAPHGYGYFSIGAAHSSYAHRFSYLIHKGEIPTGLYVCHTCDVRRCVNPDHLWLGTYKDNSADMWRKGRGVVPPKKIGATHPQAKLTQAQVDAVRARHAAGGVTQKALAVEYGVSLTHLNRVIRGRFWGNGYTRRH